MKRGIRLLAGCLLLSGSAWAAAENCAWVNDQNQWYISPNGYALPFGLIQTKPVAFPEAATPYLARMSRMIAAQGTVLVTLPVPYQGMLLVEKEGARFPADSTFAKVSTATGKQQLKTVYADTLANLRAVGLQPFNAFDPLVTYQKAHLDEDLYYRRDSHWAPAGAKVVADSLAQSLKKSYATALAQIPTGTYTLVTDRDKPIQAPQGYSRLVRENCPGTKLPTEGETYPTVSVDHPVGADQGQALLGDDGGAVVLAGTSFTSSPPNFGFAPALSAALERPVMNVGQTGGGALGSLIEYYSTQSASDTPPSLLIWEFPITVINDSSADLGFSPQRMRQLLPWIDQAPKVVGALKTQASNTTSTVLDASNLQVSPNGNFLELSFTGPMTRSFKAVLTYAKDQETVNLQNPRGTELSRYRLELASNGQQLKRVELQFEKADAWNVAATLSAYSKKF